MKVSTGNAINERFFLGGVREFEIVAELARDRKGLGFTRFRSGGLRLPGLFAPNTEWSGIGGLRRTFGAKDPLVDVEAALYELG